MRTPDPETLRAAVRAQEQYDYWKVERDDLIQAAYMDGHSYRAIAAATGLSVGGASAIIRKDNGRATPRPSERERSAV